MRVIRLAACRMGLVLALSLAGCDAPATGTAASSSAAAQPSAAPETARPAAAASANANQVTTLDATVLSALSGSRPSTAGVVVPLGGMTCSPTAIRSLAPEFTLTLPADRATRTHPLIVVTPERGWLSIHAPYDADVVDGEDVVRPSDVIGWPAASAQARFPFRAEELDGLRPNADAPEAVFLEPGRYLFALVSGTDLALMAVNEQPLRVLAACTVDWTPEVG